MSHDVIVFDDEYIYAAKEVKGYSDALVKKIDAFVRDVNVILEKAINDKEISSKLENLIVEVESVKGEIEASGQSVSKACKDYVKEIDAADQFLY